MSFTKNDEQNGKSGTCPKAGFELQIHNTKDLTLIMKLEIANSIRLENNKSEMFLFELLRLCLVLLIRETRYNFKSLHKKLFQLIHLEQI